MSEQDQAGQPEQPEQAGEGQPGTTTGGMSALLPHTYTPAPQEWQQVQQDQNPDEDEQGT